MATDGIAVLLGALLYALAEHVLQKGERVVMGARTVGPMNELASRYPDRGLAVELDVTQPDQRASAVQRCEDHFGSLDVLVDIRTRGCGS